VLHLLADPRQFSVCFIWLSYMLAYRAGKLLDHQYKRLRSTICNMVTSWTSSCSAQCQILNAMPSKEMDFT